MGQSLLNGHGCHSSLTRSGTGLWLQEWQILFLLYVCPSSRTQVATNFVSVPARDHEGVFRIGVAISDQPEGPFIPEKAPIAGSYSIDPAVFIDDDSQV